MIRFLSARQPEADPIPLTLPERMSDAEIGEIPAMRVFWP